jgi:hypothetical protein
VFSIQHFVPFNVMSHSTFCPIWRFFQSKFHTIRPFVPVDVYSIQCFVPFGIFSIQRFVPFGVLSFDVLSFDVFYCRRFLLRYFVGEPIHLLLVPTVPTSSPSHNQSHRPPFIQTRSKRRGISGKKVHTLGSAKQEWASPSGTWPIYITARGLRYRAALDRGPLSPTGSRGNKSPPPNTS